MGVPEYIRIVTQSGLADAIIGPAIKQGDILNTNYQPDGRLRKEIVQSLTPLLPYAWDVVGAISAGQLNRRIRLLQPGSFVHVGAYVSTAPSGTCTITLTGQSAGVGLFTIATVQIASGQLYGDSVIPVSSLPAGTWVGVSITTASGAAGLSVTAAFLGGA